MSALILSTKISIPPLREDCAMRPRLLEQCATGLGRKLLLVSAPAGFGKTTLLTAWINHERQRRQVRFGWLSLDREDSTLARFWAYFIRALQVAAPEVGAAALGMLETSAPAPVETVLTVLLNAIAAYNQPLVLVLDDYHLLEAVAIHESLRFFLEHQPAHFHLVLATRVDPPWPLARLRARQQIAELRQSDLRFTDEEAAEFFHRSMRLDLSPADIAALDARTEGWIAGLQMAALSLQRQSDTRAFITAFTSSNRYIFDYLLEEVLQQQSPAVQDFLLKTAILEQMTVPLCDAVLERNDSQDTLAYLERDNLFLIPLDHERRWYRYHHLFADLLRKQFESVYPDQVARSHLRASAWYESQGAIHEAVMHTQAAGDDDRVVYLIERYAGKALMQGELMRVCRWIEVLPEETIRARSLLCLVRAWTLITAPDTRKHAASWLERGLALSATNPHPVRELDGTTRTDDEIISQNAFLFRVNLAIVQQTDPEELIDLCLEALEALPEEATFERGGVNFYLAQAYRQLHNKEAAAQVLAQAKHLGLAVEGHSIALAVAGFQAIDAWDQGDLYAVAKICREAMTTLIQPAEQAGEPVHPYACLVYVYLGRTLAEWNRLEEAELMLVQGVNLAERIAEPGAQVDGCRDLARLYWLQGDFQRAHAWMDKAVQACPWNPNYLYALRARIWLAQAKDDPSWLDKAIQWADGRTLADPGDYSWELQSLVRVRIAQYRAYGKPDLPPVLAVLDGHIEAPAATSKGWQIEVMLLKALLLQALRRMEEAMPSLARALAVAQTTGHVLIFLEHGLPMVDLLHEAVRRNSETHYARQILVAFERRGLVGGRQTQPPSPEARPSVQTALAEPLSERELQVLHLLKSPLSQREIADRLYLSVNTVRTHAKHIYDKLGVHGRIEAIARAEELGLL
ncbi:MAG: hypothetical protein JXA33_22335 [Anaerolineae bacterium]|nr:hypothetical protein [Anaerolineae bacterium]